MNKWIAEDMVFEISGICECFSKNDFDKLVLNGNFDAKASDGIKRNILEYLCGDIPDERALKRIGVPTRDYILGRAKLYEIDPEVPSESDKRVQLDLIIDGVESDLTLVMHAYKRNEGSWIRVYDALTL